MATIILTFMDSKNGVVNTSYDFPDEDLDKIYKSYANYLAPMSNDPDYEPKNISCKDVVDTIYNTMLSSVTSLTFNEEIKLACQKLDIKPIKSTGRA